MTSTTRQFGRAPAATVALGLRPNWRQFALLVAVNAFVGGMVGLERSVLPLLARDEFGVSSKTAALSFIAAFGLAKALSNLVAGGLSERLGRKRVLVIGWLAAVPVPFVLILAPGWGWVVAANLALGLNQGLAWSMTVNMKIDLVGKERRGLALGLNEAAGYLAVAGVAYLTGVIAEARGLRPEPFYLGIGIAAIGLGLSAVVVRDTRPFVDLEAGEGPGSRSPRPLAAAFADASWRKPGLWGLSQAGLVNNLNDAATWGMLPLFFASRGLSLERTAFLAAAYPLVWGGTQVVTGWLSDSTGRKPLIVGGMLVQAVALWLVTSGSSVELWAAAVALLGLGTAMVYPTLLAAIGDSAAPVDRSSMISVYRFWRDAGTIAGALGGGLLADVLGFTTAIRVVALLTLASGLVARLTLGGSTGRLRQ